MRWSLEIRSQRATVHRTTPTPFVPAACNSSRWSSSPCQPRTTPIGRCRADDREPHAHGSGSVNGHQEVNSSGHKNRMLVASGTARWRPGRATLLRAVQTPLEPLPALGATPGTAGHVRATRRTWAAAMRATSRTPGPEPRQAPVLQSMREVAAERETRSGPWAPCDAPHWVPSRSVWRHAGAGGSR
jgi:hypothetical protein